MGLCDSRSSRLLTTGVAPPAVFFVFVKPSRTQKPMKSASTKAVLTAGPFTTSQTVHTISQRLTPAPPAAVWRPARRNTRGRAALLPSRLARPCADCAAPLLRGVDAHHAATAWRATQRRPRTGIGCRSAAPARSGSAVRPVLVVVDL